MTVRELLHRIDSRELTEWLAFYALEADDERRARAAADEAKNNRR